MGSSTPNKHSLELWCTEDHLYSKTSELEADTTAAEDHTMWHHCQPTSRKLRLYYTDSPNLENPGLLWWVTTPDVMLTVGWEFGVNNMKTWIKPLVGHDAASDMMPECQRTFSFRSINWTLFKPHRLSWVQLLTMYNPLQPQWPDWCLGRDSELSEPKRPQKSPDLNPI